MNSNPAALDTEFTRNFNDKPSLPAVAQPNTAASAVSWRDVLPIHPAAELFGLLGDDELHQLNADIRKHGLREPVVLQRQYRRRAPTAASQLALVDGRGRLDSMEKAD